MKWWNQDLWRGYHWHIKWQVWFVSEREARKSTPVILNRRVHEKMCSHVDFCASHWTQRSAASELSYHPPEVKVLNKFFCSKRQFTIVDAGRLTLRDRAWAEPEIYCNISFCLPPRQILALTWNVCASFTKFGWSLLSHFVLCWSLFDFSVGCALHSQPPKLAELPFKNLKNHWHVILLQLLACWFHHHRPHRMHSSFET